MDGENASSTVESSGLAASKRSEVGFDQPLKVPEKTGMAIQLLRLSALLSVLLQLGCTSGGAQVKTVYEFPPKRDTLECNNDGNCAVVVHVRVTASDKCEAMAEYKTVTVKAGKTPKMRWDIEPLEPGHVYDYRFAFEPTLHPPVYGIEIVNNTPSDFDAPGYEKTFFGKDDKTKFKWDNKHGTVIAA
jgi:hypothetical protein